MEPQSRQSPSGMNRRVIALEGIQVAPVDRVAIQGPGKDSVIAGVERAVQRDGLLQLDRLGGRARIAKRSRAE